jgi:uncharacterized delta-60 repeat protein
MKKQILLGCMALIGILISNIANAQLPARAPVFGTNGQINYLMSTISAGASPKAGIIQEDGWVVIAGTGFPSAPWPAATMLRFNPTCGTIDSSFSTNGVFVNPIQTISTINSIALQSDGKVVASGAVNSSFDTNGWPLVFRINPDGILDSAFNESGFVRDNLRDNIGAANKVLVSNDNSVIALVKGASLFNMGFGAIKYKNNGERDSTFGENGFADVPYPYTQHQRAQSGCFSADSSIWMVTLAGTGPSGTRHPSVAKLTKNGQRDSSFNETGFREYLDIDFNLQSNFQLKMQELQDGRLLIGYGINASNQSITKLMMLKSNGDLDNAFTENGIFTYGTTARNGEFEIVAQGNILYFIGVHWNNGPAGIIRLLPNGTLDTSFGNNGLVAFSHLPDNGGNDFRKFNGGFILPNGDLLAFGDGPNTGFAASRFTFNPDIDGIPQITQNGNELSTIGLGAFQWYWNNEPIEGANSNTYTATENGNYTVSMGFEFCSFTSSDTVVINNIGVNVEEILKDQISIRNNPSNDFIYVDRAPSQTIYEIINLEGKVVEAPRRLESNQISVQHLSSGLYFLRLINGNQSALFKIIRTDE